jgi:hypothetical protein
VAGAVQGVVSDSQAGPGRNSAAVRFQGQYEDAETGLFYNRVTKNPHNNMAVMIDGKYVPGDEWLVKGYIRPSEIKGKRQVP